MAIHEKFGSRTGSNSTGKDSAEKRHYVITGSDNADTVKSTIEAYAPTVVGTKVRKKVDAKQIAKLLWEGTARYVDKDKKDEDEQQAAGEFKFSFDTMGQTFHLNQSKETISSTGVFAFTATDYEGTIGVNGDQIDGVDVIIPGLRFQLTYKIANASLTLPYVKSVADLTGQTNDANFKGFLKGELLFLGATGQQSISADPEIDFHFLYSKNLTNIPIGKDPASPLFTIPLKDGHHYLWVEYTDFEDPISKRMTKQPLAGYVERVYDPGDFSVLGVGT